MSEKVYVVILNWNGWQDTIECLESVMRSDYPNFRVIVCDNGSDDESVEKIRAWADGVVSSPVPQSPAIRGLVDPPLRKPLRVSEVVAGQWPLSDTDDDRHTILLIKNQRNLGFARGNNEGIRYALSRSDMRFVWLLNNDTVVSRSAMAEIVSRMIAAPRIGMCGATLLYYHRPDMIQARGGASYNRWTGFGRQLAHGVDPSAPCDAEAIERNLSYVSGASCMVSRPFLEQVGLLSEDYFLYFEEIDWASRAIGLFTLGYAPRATVYHKEGASIGTRSKARRNSRSELSERFLARSRLIYTKKFIPQAMPSVVLASILYALKHALRGNLVPLKALIPQRHPPSTT